MNVKKEIAFSLRRCAWGFVLILFDLNIGAFDIFPDWLGYIFLLLGVIRLSAYREDVRHLRVFALVLLAHNVISFIEKIFDDELYSGFNALTIVISVISLYFYFAFFTCAANIAEEYVPEKQRSIIVCRNAYAILYCFSTVAFFFEGSETLALISVIANLISLLAVCFCLFSLAGAIRNMENEDII